MTWSYRAIRHKGGWYAVHEVYYSDKHEPSMVTEDPIEIIVDRGEGGKKALKWTAKCILKDLELPVLKFEDFTEEKVDKFLERSKKWP